MWESALGRTSDCQCHAWLPIGRGSVFTALQSLPGPRGLNSVSLGWPREMG